ncbi:MAG: MoxR family ATPase [Candidatus Thiosymbion ectosymbiont of Robbea hypermnestra]|nr:MoxR family ATPase [Candidatus Thiosymbion ectosymbiont of Robbea hypermnestra]
MNPDQYPLNLIPADPEQAADQPEKWLRQRPFSEYDRSFEVDAGRFVPGAALATAMNTALAVGEPLLLTGEPGTGKTQAAYYAAHQLGTRVFHFQVKSETTARDLLYHFNMVQYFHDAHLQGLHRDGEAALPAVGGAPEPLDKRRYVEPRTLWQAFKYGEQEDKPAVVLIDEIDKATRDFPNDLLHELDQMEFTITETERKIKIDHRLRPIVYITSNSERQLPEPFLRRCVYHHIHFDQEILERAVAMRRKELGRLSDDLVELAIRRFLALRARPQLRKPPATGELLVWLRVLSLALETEPARLAGLKTPDLKELPYLQVLLKDHRDQEELGEAR